MPAEGLAALTALKARRVYLAPLEDLDERIGAILPYYSDESNRREKGGGVREIDRRAADDVIALAEGGFDGVNADGTCDEKRHESRAPGKMFTFWMATGEFSR